MSYRFAPIPLTRLFAALALTWVVPPGLQAQTTAAAPQETSLPVQRVVLSTAGVGYFQHGGEVTGNATVPLSVTPAQLNDLLKSLVVDDAGGGKVAAVDYPGNEPLARTLGDLGVDLSANPSLSALFMQLRGAEIKLALEGGESVSGRILGVETRQRATEAAVFEVSYVSLAAADGIRAIDIGAIRRFEATDPGLRDALGKALDALAENGRQDRKTVSVHFNGQGPRRVSLGYVVEAPLWKTSYRLNLPPADGDGKAGLQAWAIVENTTPHDWRNIELALVSGRPLSFVEDLYQSQFLPRPEHRPQRFTGVAPQVYGAATSFAEAEMADSAPRMQAKSARALGAPAPAPAPAAPPAAGFAQRQTGQNDALAPTAQAEQLGATFQYVIPAVDLPSRRSAMLPLVVGDIAATRLSIYDRDVVATHPLHGVRLSNTTGKHLPGGPVTLLESGGYAGDARIDDLPAGAERLLSFAIDLEVSVQQRDAGLESTLGGGRIENGMLMLRQVRTKQTRYALKNEAAEARQLLIAHPVTPGWALADTPEPAERTERQYRFDLALPKTSTREFTIQEQRVDWEHVTVAQLDEQGLIGWSRDAALPQGVREAIARAAELRRTIASAEQAVDAPQQRIAEIHAEQERIRANLQALQQGTPLHDRLIERLNEQETTLESLERDLAAARQQHQQAVKAFEDYLAKLTVA